MDLGDRAQLVGEGNVRLSDNVDAFVEVVIPSPYLVLPHIGKADVVIVDGPVTGVAVLCHGLVDCFDNFGPQPLYVGRPAYCYLELKPSLVGVHRDKRKLQGAVRRPWDGNRKIHAWVERGGNPATMRVGTFHTCLEQTNEDLDHVAIFALEMRLPCPLSCLVVGLVIFLFRLLNVGLLQDEVGILVKRIEKVGRQLVGIMLVISDKLRRMLSERGLELPWINRRIVV